MAADTARSLRRSVVVAVVAVTALALLARFLFLGARVAHWDEGRVAYWTLDFARTGSYYYRPIIHGPFFHHVNRIVFALFGPTDASMRAVTALVGGLLPLSALLFRSRLRDSELVALALFLAANPVLLYFSRFMRGDVIVGAFVFVGFGLLVRGIDARQPWYLVPAALAIAVGFTAKENAFAYLAAWLGASVLLLDHRLLRARDRDGARWQTVAATRVRRVWTALRRSLPQLVVAVVGFLTLVVAAYAPRGDVPSTERFYRYCAASYDPLVDMGGVVGLGDVLASPGAIPDVLLAATVGSTEVFACQWVGGAVEGGNAYLPFFGDLLRTVGYGAAALSLLAVVGFLVDRYGGERPRDLPTFAFYWGVASLLGYPVITDIAAPWAAVHVVLPLAIPAAVGAALVYRQGMAALAADDRLGVGVAFGILLLVSGQVAGAAVYTSYVAPQSPDNELVQYAQPAGQLQPTLRDTERLAAGTGGTDVLLYGDHFVDGDEDAVRSPACARWFNALPLPWYWERADVNVSCVTDEDALDAAISGDRPPVVVARARHQSRLEPRLEGYESRRYLLRAYDTETVFFVREE
jgi:uncharacterized protein (TIGR03663 family)